MEILSQYEIPYLHPLAVHFPLVLLLVGAAATAIYAWRGTPAWRWAALVLVGLGAAGAVWASETGETLEDAVEGEPVATVVLPHHARGAAWTVRVSVLATLALAGAAIWARRRPADRDPPAVRLVALILVAIAAALVAWTAHLGGIMVWGVPTG